MDTISQNRVSIEYCEYGENAEEGVLTFRPVQEQPEDLSEDASEELPEEIILKRYGLYGFTIPNGMRLGVLADSSDDNAKSNAAKDDNLTAMPDTAEDENHTAMPDAAATEKINWLDTAAADFHFYKETRDTVTLVLRNNRDKTQYQTNIFLTGGSTDQEVLKMLKTIYDEQPLLLLSVFQKTPLDVYLDKNSNIKDSMDTRLALIKQCITIYHKQYTEIRKSPKFKLKQLKYIDRINKLTNVTQATLSFIAQNPQHLVEVNRKRGIKYDGKVYLPAKTLVEKNIIDYNTYENQYIVSFLKMLLLECPKMARRIRRSIEEAATWKQKVTPKSQKNDFESLAQKYQRQLHQVCQYEQDLQSLFTLYQKFFHMEKEKNITGKLQKPRATAVFRQLSEYSIFFTEAFLPWFEHGAKIDDNRVDREKIFTTAISTPSTTYELYIVTMWVQYFQEMGYTFDANHAKYAGMHEEASRYQDYAYEFIFYKHSMPRENGEVYRDELILYYSPSVYIPQPDKNSQDKNQYKISENNVDRLLYRNTKKSLVRNSDETNGIGAHYEPDFIIMLRRGTYTETNHQWTGESIVRYIMADAKHKQYDEVCQKDMPELIYKYLNSIKICESAARTAEVKAKIAGLCAIYHQHKQDSDLEESTDYFEYDAFSAGDEPFAKMIYMNVNEADSNPAAENEKNAIINILDDVIGEMYEIYSESEATSIDNGN
ncbi:MAG: DUF2357 domain-containing protein [Lachnospiraceae bacterium]|nr:DUF2357 domain-containing protein [Lachnospiraceae bacterium]